ncbi:unnamed protein product, partial [Effrenium voratum]
PMVRGKDEHNVEAGADGFLKELRQAFSSGRLSGVVQLRHASVIDGNASVSCGESYADLSPHYSDAGGRMSEAQTQVLRMLWDLAKHNLRDRREFALTGGHSAILSLIKKGEIQDGYVRVKAGPAQISLIADKVVEPSDDSVVHLLEALPPMEALYYAKETNVIERGGKSEQIQLEIEQQYGFVGGTKAEYIKYFRREDLPSNMWTWMPYSEVKAVAACDQSNAFTKVLCPKWFYPYQAVPPVVAAERGATPGADMPAEERKEAGRIDCDEDETNAYDMSDEDWWSVFSKGANLGRKDAGYSVHEWMQHLIDLKKRDFRTITIMIFFAGERRQDDIQSQVERMAKVRNISVSVISVDLATDDRWDLASKETFHVILQMMKGFVDIVLGGPPCATVSRARKRESGKQMGFGYITWRYASPYLDKEELICGNTPKTQGRIDVNLLRVVTGIWMHGAQLRATGTDQLLFPYTYEQYRVLMGLPQHVVVPDEDSPSYLPQEAREPAMIQEPVRRPQPRSSTPRPKVRIAPPLQSRIDGRPFRYSHAGAGGGKDATKGNRTRSVRPKRGGEW